MQNAENTISEPLAFKILGGGCPHTRLQTRASGARFQAPPVENRLCHPCLDLVNFFVDLYL